MKSFDQQYFDKWYRHPTYKIGTQADLERQVRLALSAAEYMLTRPVRSVLDVGAGEGRWQPVLRALRPRVQYTGVDPSEYSVRRYGASRNIVRGTFDDLDTLFHDRTFDLVICCSVLNYLPRPAFTTAVAQLAARTHGLAFLEIFTSADEVVGDTNHWYTETPATYRQMLRRAGFIPCGLHCYITSALDTTTAALELA
jgi:SAM-dependent methyltransferase